MTNEEIYALIQQSHTAPANTAAQTADFSGYSVNPITGTTTNPYTSDTPTYGIDPQWLINNPLFGQTVYGMEGPQEVGDGSFRFNTPDGTPMTAKKVGDNYRVHQWVDMGGGMLGNKHSEKYNGIDYDEYDASGKFLGGRKFEGLDGTLGPWAGLAVAFGGPMAGSALAGGAAAAGAGGAAGAGAGAGAGAAGLSAAELAAGAGLSFGAPMGAEAMAAYAAMAGMSVPEYAAALAATGSGAGLGGAGAAGAAGAAGGGGAAAGGLGGAATSGGGILSSLGSALGGGGAGGGWTSLIGPALTAAGGIYGANQAGNAADAQLQAQREAMALAEPWRQAGMNGLNRLQELLGVGGNAGAADYGSAARDFSMADFNADPGYQFRQDQGMKALERSAAARGGLYSGKAIKDTLDFSQGLASQEYGNAFNRFQTNRAAKINPLQSLAGVGRTAANTMGVYASNAGDAQAAGIMGKSNALTNALGQGFSMYSSQQNRNTEQNLLDRVLRSRGY